MRRRFFGAMLSMTVLAAALLAGSCDRVESDDSIIMPADYTAVEAPAERPEPVAEFTERDSSRDVRGRDGWYIYARRDAATGRLVELIISDRHPTSVRQEEGRERVIFNGNGQGGQRFAGNTNMLAMLKHTDERMQMQVKALPELTPDPVSAYRRRLEAEPTLSLREFIATGKELAFIPGLQRFFGLQ